MEKYNDEKDQITKQLNNIRTTPSNKIPEENLKEIQDFIDNFDNISIINDIDFCDRKEFLIKKGLYNNDFGYAFFYIPVPKSKTNISTVTLNNLSEDKQIAYYTCNGDIFRNKIRLVPKILFNLNTGRGRNADLLKINVDYSQIKDEYCEKEHIGSERKKGSTVPGEPQFVKPN